MQTYGDAARPIRRDPWHMVKEVGWSVGRVATVSVEAEFGHARTDILDPALGQFDDLIRRWVFNTEGAEGDGDTLTKDDYKDYSLIVVANTVTTGSLVIENAITGVTVGDAFAGSSAHYSGNPIVIAMFDQQIADISAQVGRGPDMSIVPGTFKTIENTVTQPNGHQVTYVDHYEPILVDDVGFEWNHWDTYLWFHTTTIPEQRVDIKRQSYLVNFGKGTNDPVTVNLAGVVNHFAASLPSETVKFEIKIYSYGTEFTQHADMRLAPTDDRQPIVSISGTMSAAIAPFILARFNKDGLVTT